MRPSLRCASLLPVVMALAVAPAVPAEDVPSQTCDAATVSAVGRFLGVRDFRLSSQDSALRSVLVAAVCKPSPDDPSITLTAIAYDAGVPDSTALVVARVDAARSKVVASWRSRLDDEVT